VEVAGRQANLRNLSDPKPTVGAPYFRNNSWRDLGPRIGFAWSPFSSGKTAVRGGAGIFYVPNDPALYFTPGQRTPPFMPEFTLQNFDPELFPSGIAVIQSVGTPQGSPEAIEFNIKSPRTYQYNLDVQHQIGDKTVLSVSYIGNLGRYGVLVSDANAPEPFYNGTSLEVSPSSRRPNPNFEVITFYSGNANSSYNGLAFSLQRRFADGLQTSVSYTYSKSLAMGDSNAKTNRSGSGSPRLKSPYHPQAAKGLGGYHLGQKLSVNYSYDLPLSAGRGGIVGQLLSGWQLAGIITLQDGQPFSVANASGATATALSQLGYLRGPSVDDAFPKDNLIKGGPEQYFDPNAFYLPGCLPGPGIAAGCAPSAVWQLGNAGRNTITGPGIAKWDVAVNKTASITERWRLQFRTEIFNLTNRVNFGIPSASIFTSQNRRVDTAGQISSTVGSSRQIQFGLKLLF
jgi:hypothetical protein